MLYEGSARFGRSLTVCCKTSRNLLDLITFGKEFSDGKLVAYSMAFPLKFERNFGPRELVDSSLMGSVRVKFTGFKYTH